MSSRKADSARRRPSGVSPTNRLRPSSGEGERVTSWMCHGDEDCVVQISLTGKVEYLAEDGSVESYSDTGTARAAYLEHCEREGLTPDRRILGQTPAAASRIREH